MKKIFVQFGSGLGSLSRVFPIVKILKEHGYIIKYSGYPTAKKYMNMIGIDELDENFCFNDKKLKSPRAEWTSSEEFWEMMGYNDPDWIMKKVNQLSHSIKEFSPDLIITDLGFLCWMSAKLLNIPIVSITQSCYHPERKFDYFRWWEKKEPINNCHLTTFINERFKENYIKPINKFEEIFTGDLTLIPSYEETDWLNNENKFNTHFVGPILLNEGSSDDISINNNKPTVFCYTGRFYDNVGKSGESIFRSTLKAFETIDANLIVSVGGTEEKELAQNIIKETNYKNENLQIVEFVPMETVYNISDIVIHHGGHGSCLGQIDYKIPSLIIPTHSEREYNARIFEKLGFSEVISRNELCAEKIKEKITKMLTDNLHKQKISDYYDIVKNKKNVGVNYAVKLIEEML